MVHSHLLSPLADSLLDTASVVGMGVTPSGDVVRAWTNHAKREDPYAMDCPHEYSGSVINDRSASEFQAASCPRPHPGP